MLMTFMMAFMSEVPTGMDTHTSRSQMDLHIFTTLIQDLDIGNLTTGNRMELVTIMMVDTCQETLGSRL